MVVRCLSLILALLSCGLLFPANAETADAPRTASLQAPSECSAGVWKRDNSIPHCVTSGRLRLGRFQVQRGRGGSNLYLCQKSATLPSLATCFSCPANPYAQNRHLHLLSINTPMQC